MRLQWKTLAGSLTGLLLLPAMAGADDVAEQLRQMQERMERMEDRLEAQNEQLDAAEERVQRQERVIQEAGIGDDSAASGLSRFLEMTEFSGVIAASYNYNWNSPKAGSIACANNPGATPCAGATAFGGSGGGSTTGGFNTGAFGLTAPFNQSPNNFQLDQVYFSMLKPSTVESRGGFGVDFVYGAAADALRAAGGTSGDLSFLYQAYVSYLAPIGNGILVQAGRYETILGAEVLRADANMNITRGLVYALQPTSHTGVLLSGDVGGGVSWAAGIANDYLNTMADSDNDKVFLGQLAWGGDTTSLSTSFLVGGDVANPFGVVAPNPVGRNNDRLYVLDLVATWDPSDNLSMWANFDYYWPESDGLANQNYWGLAAASRLGITETIGAALRGEVVKGNNANGAGGADTILWELTATIDWALTDSLKLLFETRYDRGTLQGAPNGVFFKNAVVATNRDQVLSILQLLYTF
jgi:hypothetical protein